MKQDFNWSEKNQIKPNPILRQFNQIELYVWFLSKSNWIKSLANIFSSKSIKSFYQYHDLNRFCFESLNCVLSSRWQQINMWWEVHVGVCFFNIQFCKWCQCGLFMALINGVAVKWGQLQNAHLPLALHDVACVQYNM